MSLPFPACGSLYFTKDFEKVTPGLGVPLEDTRFCAGRTRSWRCGMGEEQSSTYIEDRVRMPLSVSSLLRPGTNRTTIDPSAGATLAAAAHKEIAYLKRFGQPLLPLRRERRPVTSTSHSCHQTTSRTWNGTSASRCHSSLRIPL